MIARFAAAWLLISCVALGAGADENGDLSGTWIVNGRLSDDPEQVLGAARIAASSKPDGALKRVARSVVVFGIPVGQLPLPGGDSTPSKPDFDPFREHVPQALEPVDELRIVQEAAATQFDYGNGDLLIYRHDVAVDSQDLHVSAAWQDGNFVIDHEFVDGGTLSETYRIDTNRNRLYWTVTVQTDKAKLVTIERVYDRRTD